jgi:hypothetical protein
MSWGDAVDAKAQVQGILRLSPPLSHRGYAPYPTGYPLPVSLPPGIPLPGRPTITWPASLLEISELDRSLKIAQRVASETGPAGPAPGSVLRSAPFRNTVALLLHVMPN